MQHVAPRVTAAIAGMFLFCATAVPANGDPIAIFTFEQFTVPPADFGPRTPLLDVAPSVGPASFRADFTTVPFPDLFAIARFPHSFTSDNVLIGRDGSANSLTVTFNEYISSVTFPFLATGFRGTLQFWSPVGTTAVTAELTGNTKDSFTAGILSFQSARPFNTFTLSTDSNTFAIDNLTVEISPVAEPATLLLVGGGLIGVRRMRRRSQRERAMTGNL